jgi:glycosyltransferase involved in cell wall biosynthesis
MAKFAKELARNDYEVWVLYAKSSKKNSPWTKDIVSKNIIAFATKSKFPEIFFSNPSSILDKVRYKLAWKKMERTVQANFFDRAAQWGPNLMAKAEAIIQKNDIKNVIATGGPFHTLYHAAKLKVTFPDINLILDYRDQWVDNQSFMGMKTIGEERLNREKEMEQFALNRADHVITVAKEMTENVRKRSVNSNCSFHTILNGFDKDDLLKSAAGHPSNIIPKLVFTGTLYDGLEEILFPFFDAVAQRKISLDFYGTAPNVYQNYVKGNGHDNIKFHGKIPLQEVYQKIEQADYCCLFLNDDHLFSTSTKYFEYLGMRKRILVVSNPGGLQEFVEENNIGFGLKPQNNFAELDVAIERKKEPFPNFDVEKYSTEAATKKLMDLLQ